MLSNSEIKLVIESIKYRERISQKKIAEELGYKEPYLSDILNGRKPVNELFLKNLNNKFGVSMEFLHTGNGEMFQKSKTNADDIVIPREVFRQISRLTETVLSQQKTIEILSEKI